ncbi:hypothetical protein L6Q79_00110 [bacterium]|nr:hypothetical protein [bacterium]NUN46090.1 hypothetical protein [bacterium]
MKVRIVCYEDVDAWILGKFALRMQECLKELKVESDISKFPDTSADINHHIIYLGYDGQSRGIDTLMITHIDTIDKLNLLKKQMTIASAGICMSNETMSYLSRMGIDKKKLCYVNPAHDGVMRKRKIVIGLSCRVQVDGRKREYFLDKLSKTIDADYFKFKIMGDGWERQVNSLRKEGFEVDYFDHFNYSQYIELIPSLDYYLYMGMDEGQMGFIDAVAAGVKTIVTTQGYHLDASNAIIHPFTEYEELENIFLNIEKGQKKLVNSVASWNWLDYTRKHIELWNYLLDNRKNKSDFKDGINSLLIPSDKSVVLGRSFVIEKTIKLWITKYFHFFYPKTKKLKETYASKGLAGVVALFVNKILGGRI